MIDSENVVLIEDKEGHNHIMVQPFILEVEKTAGIPSHH